MRVTAITDLDSVENYPIGELSLNPELQMARPFASLRTPIHHRHRWDQGRQPGETTG